MRVRKQVLDRLPDSLALVLRSRLARNSLFNLVGFLVPSLLMFAFTPILVARMGDEDYGLWVVSLSMLGLSGVLDFGLGTALAKYVAEYSAKGDRVGLSTSVTGAFAIYLVAGAAFGSLLFVLAPCVASLFSTSANDPMEVSRLVRIVAIGLVPLLLKGGGLAIPAGLQRYEIPLIVTIGQNALTLGTALIVVLLGGDVEYVVLSMVLVMWVSALAAVGVAIRLLRQQGMRFLFSWSRLRRVLGFAGYSGLTTLGGQLFNSFDKVLVGAMLGVSSVTYYAVSVAVANKILSFAGVLSTALMPDASSLCARGEDKRLWERFNHATLFVSALSFAAGMFLLVVSHPFLEWWMGPAFAQHALPLFRILVVVYTGIAVNAPAFHIVNGMGAPWVSAVGSIGGGIATLALIVLLGRFAGLEGTGWANLGYWWNFILIGYVARTLGKRIRAGCPQI